MQNDAVFRSTGKRREEVIETQRGATGVAAWCDRRRSVVRHTEERGAFSAHRLPGTKMRSFRRGSTYLSLAHAILFLFCHKVTIYQRHEEKIRPKF